MSSSKGKVISLPDVLKVYPPEIVRYMFAGTRPNTEFSISFDLDVLKTYEDYDKTERIAWGVDKAKNDDVYAKERRIYELSQVDGMPEVMPYQMPLRHLCNLLQTNSGDIDAVLAALPDVKPEQVAKLRTRCECAWYWITECAPEEFRFSLQPVGTTVELDPAGREVIRKIYEQVLPIMDTLEEKPLSEAVYAVATESGMEPKALFTIVYQVLIGKNAGPRLANFMKIIGSQRLKSILGQYL